MGETIYICTKRSAGIICLMIKSKIVKEDICLAILLTLTFLPNLVSIFSGILGITLLSNAIAYIICAFVICLIFLYKTTYIHIPKISVYLYTFLTYFISSAIYSISTKACEEKVVNIVYSILIPILIILIAFSLTNETQRNNIIKYYLCLGAELSKIILSLNAILLLLGFTDSTEGRQYVIGIGNPIWAARYAGMLVVFIIARAVKNRRITASDILFTIIGFVIVFKTGSRAPLIALLFSTLFLLWPDTNKKQKTLFIFGTIIMALLYLLYSGRSTSGAADYSNQARLLLISKAFEAQFNIFLGAGIGSFNLLTTGIDENYYPHNMEIETYIETGIIGLSLLLILLYKSFRLLKRDIISLLFLFYFINAQFSGDLAGNNMMFIYAQVLYFTYYCHSKYSHIDEKNCYTFTKL